MGLSLVVLTLLNLDVVQVRTAEELRAAVGKATPGTEIRIAFSTFAGGLHFENVHGTAERPITIRAAKPETPPIFMGGNGLQFSEVSYLEIHDLRVQGSKGNGVNIDDGGRYETPSHHVTLRNLYVSDLPKGNYDGIKLSGVDDFRVENCRIEGWGGSAIDMVGCHRGRISGSKFGRGGDNGVQTKGGSSDIEITRCRFESTGERGVNIGGSTGEPFFRPPLPKMPPAGKYEAKNIFVQGCTFSGSTAPIAFVGVDGATVRFNTLIIPERWAIRILQETRLPGFVPSRNGVFENNLITFWSDRWASGGVNVGDGTASESFRFRGNFWYCIDAPDQSRPRLPTAERDGVYGRNPMLKDDLTPKPGSPAMRYGAHAWGGKG